MIEFGLNLLETTASFFDRVLAPMTDFLPEILGILVIFLLIRIIRRLRYRRRMKKSAAPPQGALEKTQAGETADEAVETPEAVQEAEAKEAEIETEEAVEPPPTPTDTSTPPAEPIEAPAEAAPAPEIEEEGVGFFKRLRNGLSKTRNAFSRQIESAITSGRGIDDEALEQIEEALITADVGVDTTTELITRLARSARSIEDMEAFRDLLKTEMRSLIDYGEPPASFSRPYVIMVVGVNGVGKTTTIGKLAAKYRSEGKKVVLGAADTFRAAAVEQLEIWAERAGSDIVKHRDKADPAAVAYDTVQAALAREADIVIIDTAGRLRSEEHTSELQSLRRISYAVFCLKKKKKHTKQDNLIAVQIDRGTL